MEKQYTGYTKEEKDIQNKNKNVKRILKNTSHVNKK
jgi:hypothetical protein